MKIFEYAPVLWAVIFIDMKNKEEIREELERLSPLLLAQKGRPEGFGVPKDYFNSLPDIIVDKVAPKRAPAQEPRSSWLDDLTVLLQGFFQPRYALAIASVALLLVAGVYFGTSSETPQPLAEVLLEELPDEALHSYVSDNIDEFDLSLFEEQVAGNFSETSPTSELDMEEELLDDLLDELPIDELEDLL